MKLERISPHVYAPVLYNGKPISIQASANHFCAPMYDNLEVYEEYEIWSEEPYDWLLPYRSHHADALYVFVPRELIEKEFNGVFKEATKNAN